MGTESWCLSWERRHPVCLNVRGHESLTHSGRTYYRLPVRNDLDRKQLPAWMNAPFVRMPLDWDLLRKQGNE